MLTCFDRKWTSEAVYNILDNAVKYTPAGGNMSITLLHTELFVRIAIKNSGIGICEEETSKISTRFYRSPKVSDSEGVGKPWQKNVTNMEKLRLMLTFMAWRITH